jgi:hypothetical protein
VTGGRYDGRPFLRLLECYVLWSVDQLSQDQAEKLEEMTPSLAATYGSGGTWQDIVAAQMELGPEVPGALRGMWERTLATAGGQPDAVDAERWAQEVVDANFT